ncbi:MAG TPA: DNA polymerase III subunit [Verrucomicrobiae bacterium]
MAFKDFPNHQPGVQLLQRSLGRGRLGHAYLFTGPEIEPLEAFAAALAKTLNCQHPVRQNGAPIDCCDQCAVCQKIDHGNHADVHWVRPESKIRQIKIGQITRRPNSPPRVMLEFINLRPTEARFKVGIIVAADRMNEEAANAFLKTLEEPPADSILILLSTEPQRLLETIVSRCLRLNIGGEGLRPISAEELDWLSRFSALAAAEQKSLLGRYRLMDLLLKRLTETKARIEESLSARSPLQQYKDAEEDLAARWETELAAAIESEYRRQRFDLLVVVERWLRDVWMWATLERPGSKAQSSKSTTQGPPTDQLLNFPRLEGTKRIAGRVSPEHALENLEVIEQLQRWLYTNVQEALALEVGLLKLRL